MQSKRFRQLEKAINKLNSFLPAGSPTGSYSEGEQVAIKAYKLLCHAEIEAYIEDIALKCIDNVHKRWRHTKKCSSALVHMLAIEGWSSEKKIDNNTDTRLGSAVADYKNKIKNNHGIKESNIRIIFLPLGIDLDGHNTLIVDLNSLGEQRGVIAHTSMTAHTILDPRNEKQNIDRIINGLKNLDDDVRKLT